MSGAFHWLWDAVGVAFNICFQVLWDLVVWLGYQLWFWFYGVWQKVWSYSADFIFDRVAALLTLFNLWPEPALVDYVMNYLRAANFFFPVDTIVTLLPVWASFQGACFAARVLIKTVRG